MGLDKLAFNLVENLSLESNTQSGKDVCLFGEKEMSGHIHYCTLYDIPIIQARVALWCNCDKVICGSVQPLPW